MPDCDLLEKCGFFAKYRDSLNLACRGFIKSYCTGEKMDDCERKRYRQQHGAPPVDEMLPTGQMVPSDYLS
ncbi:MAG: hypothetical protein C0621_01450 [Desulfuromonas sp.]|nr:MAG: hypothetical protein C0621_01450 [Desulfuromonas sp.]